MRRVIVIGGGITGLAAAWRRQQADASASVLVLEAAAQPGGFIRSTRREGFLLEAGPDCFISDKPAAFALCQDLGLETELIGTRPEFRRSFILKNGALHPVPEGFYLMGPTRLRPFLESSLLGWRGKWRALLEPLVRSRSATDESLASFVRRRFGQALLEELAQPLIAGIYGADPERLSLRATFPLFQDMEAKYGSVLLGLKKRAEEATDKASGARYSLFLTLRDGLQRLSDELARRLGHRLRLQAPVASVSRGQDWDVRLTSGEVLSADEVILALPSYTAADLLASADAELADQLRSIAYSPAATMNIALRALDVAPLPPGAGFVVPRRESKTLLGCTFTGQKFEGRVPKGFVLLRAFLGGEGPWRLETNETLERQVVEELKPLLKFKAAPLFVQTARWDRALPQYELGHVARVAHIQERALRHKGLTLAGNWRGGVGLPDCIASA